MSERGTGIFGQMKNEDTSRNFDYISPVEESDPNTIYKLLFEEYDEENKL